MAKEIFKQMLPFFVLLAVLWVTAEILERTMTGPKIIAEPHNTEAAAAP